MKNEPPRQLKTVPLTAEGLAAAQASAAALSKANSRDSKAPPKDARDANAKRNETASVAAVTRTSDPSRKKASRGTTYTMVAIGALAIACAGAAWTQRNTKTVV